MAISWGSWEGASPNRIRVGIEVTWTEGDGSGAVNHGSGQAQAKVEIYTDVEGNWSDSQTLSFGGSISGSTSFTNNQDNNSVLRATKTYEYNYGANEYGSSPGSRTFSASLSGAFNGATPSKSVSSSIPARPYGSPAAPTNVSVSRVSDTSQKVTWTNKDTAGEPWDLVRVQYDAAANDVWNGDVGTPSGGSTSFTHSGTAADAKYKYRVRAENSAGDSAWVETAVVYTTPEAPSGATLGGTPTAPVVSWTNHATYEHSIEVWRSVNGVWALLTTKTQGTSSHTDAVSASDKVKYKVRSRTVSGVQGTLYSAYSNETAETPGVTTPPSAPTNLSPASSAIINPGQSRAFTWQYNTTDTTAQTEFQIQWRLQGAGTWTTLAAVTSSAPSYTFAANAFPDNSSVEWQARTRGSNATFGAWSATATFKTVGDPNAARANKRGLWLDLETGETVTAPTGSFAPIGMVSPFGGVAAPPGWLMCQGQVVNQADYPDLFGVIGTRFNAGGETGSQFRLPDLQDRVPVGASGSKALGTSGGSATKTLTAAEIAHTHSTPNHTHTDNYGTNSTGSSHTHSAGTLAAGITADRANGTGNRANATITGDTGTTGSGHTHGMTGGITSSGAGTTGAAVIGAPTPLDVMNPWRAVNYIIKV